MKRYYVYLLASRRRGTLYVGMANDLIRRIYEHRSDLVPGFTKRYGIHRLVYYEECQNVNAALAREKQLKKWNRKWKLELIESNNPDWIDLYPAFSEMDSRSGRE